MLRGAAVQSIGDFGKEVKTLVPAGQEEDVRGTEPVAVVLLVVKAD